MTILTAARLRQLLHYDPETGEFTRLVGGRAFKVGDRAGFDDHGYRRISIDGVKQYAHILAHLYMTGEWPKEEVDHDDLDGMNNRWANLREASHSQNQANKRRHKDNTSGAKGVFWHPQRKKWYSRSTLNYENHFFGYHDTREAAELAYAEGAKRLFGEFARPDGGGR